MQIPEIDANIEDIVNLKTRYSSELSNLVSHLEPIKERYLKIDPYKTKKYVEFIIPPNIDLSEKIIRNIEKASLIGSLSDDCYIQLLFEAINYSENNLFNPSHIKEAFLEMCESMNPTFSQSSGATGRHIFLRASEKITLNLDDTISKQDFEYLALCFVAVEEVLKEKRRIQSFAEMGYNTIPGIINCSIS